MSRLLTVVTITGALMGVGGVFCGSAAADNDDYDDHNGRHETRRMSRDFIPAMNVDYRKECGSCHMAYPPGLLPARSWERLMGDVKDHFGENTELDPETRAVITRYLVDNAAEQADTRRAAKFLRSIPTHQTPLRITGIRYFQHKHDEIPERMVTGNPQVKSFANCTACHRTADEGDFDDDNVRIPGHENARF